MDIKANARLNQGINVTAEIGNIKEIPVGPDTYTGEYDVTAPSDGELTLQTKDKLMADDVTIEANREIENALLQNTPLDEFRNDEVTNIVNRLHLFTETNFKKIILPNVEFISGAYIFDGGNKSALEEIHLPKWSGSGGGGYAFMDGNPNLRLIDIGMANPVYMRNCPNLKTLILRKTTVPVLSGHNAWSGTPFSPDDGTGGYVYVPQSLISAYQSNASWRQHMNVLEFRPIEGSEYELEE